MKVLVVVDMQNDFIDGSLGTAEAVAIVPKVVEKISGFDGAVLATYDTHDKNYMETQEGRLLPVLHCVEQTHGWEMQDDVYDAIDKKFNTGGFCKGFTKPTFGSRELAEQLVSLDTGDEIEEVILVGLCTDICVISNALLIKAYLPEVKITVDASCCAGVTPESHNNALAAMNMCQINIENWEG